MKRFFKTAAAITLLSVLSGSVQTAWGDNGTTTLYKVWMESAEKDYSETVHEYGVFGDYGVYINGERADFGEYGEPFILENSSGSTLFVPFTPFFESVCSEVYYYKSSDGIEIDTDITDSTPPYMYASAVKGNRETRFFPNSLDISIYVNTETGGYSDGGISLSFPCCMVDGVFYVPLRDSLRAYDESIGIWWDSETKSVYVNEVLL
ncbi:MAG: copper amine oxidase N-terminal domain-containing protein [Clostridiales bacterium]|nr:copper amine oxidase N-terminal domain-containing protein [Clostridiales bacterium]